MQEHLADAVEVLGADEGTLLQMLYVKKKNGALLGFVGPKLLQGEFEQIESIAPGEVIEVLYDSSDMDHGPRVSHFN
jgi:hypothetical protein